MQHHARIPRMERFGVVLRRHRLARQLSQEELGELSGIGRTHVNRIAERATRAGYRLA